MRTTERSARLAILRVRNYLEERGVELPANLLSPSEVVLLARKSADESENVQRTLIDSGREVDWVVVV